MRLLVLAVLLALDLVDISTRQNISKGELDGELSEVLHNAQSRLMSRIMKNNRLRSAQANMHLENIFLQVTDHTTAKLYNLTLMNIIDVNLESVKPNLDQMNMEVDVSLSSLKIQGDFEVANGSVPHMKPRTRMGKFRLDLTDMKATGRVGLKLDGDTLYTINYDIDYQPAHESLTLWKNTKNGLVRLTTVNIEHFDETLQQQIDRELRYVLNKYLKKELDSFLVREPVAEHIEENRMMNIYRSHVQGRRENANAMVDAILELARNFLTKRKMQEIPIAPFNTTFSKQVLLVTWNAQFSVFDGYLKNLSTIRRTGDVNYFSGGDGVTEVSGSFGMRQLKMGYIHYVANFMGIGATGSMSVDIGNHSLFLKLRGNRTEGVSASDVQLEYIDDVKVHITGLGALNWMTSKIATWTVKIFKKKIAFEVISLIKTAIDNSLGSANLVKFFSLVM